MLWWRCLEGVAAYAKMRVQQPQAKVQEKENCTQETQKVENPKESKKEKKRHICRHAKRVESRQAGRKCKNCREE